MTHRVGLRPGDRIAPRSDGLKMLRRIADALDMPVADFYQRETMAHAAKGGPSTAECEAILTAFLRIDDAAARLGIITLMRGYATH